MSKERIKIICSDARAITDNDDIYIRCHINIRHFNWLIEQAERAQELETQQRKNDDYTWELLMDIKRYRALLERVCQVEDLEDVWDIEDDYRALEGEEWRQTKN